MSTRPLRIAFMGTPAFTVPVLEALIDGPHDIVCVYTQPPRPSGRGNRVRRTPVHDCAATHGIAVRTPDSLKKDAQARQDFSALGLDAAIVAGYGMMLPADILEGPRFGCLNIHPSLLPRWRGTAPVQYAVWHGDKETGVTVIRLVEQMDAGPIIAQEMVPVGPETTAADLDEILWPMGASLLSKALGELAAGMDLPLVKQDESQATYSKRLKREDGKIDWTQDAAAIDRQIRALNPWPGVWTMAGDKRLKILAAAPSTDNHKEPPGTVTGRNGLVACGNGTALKLITIQPENARAMDALSAINGGYLTPGARLGD